MSDHGPALWTGQSGKRSVQANEPSPNEAVAEVDEYAPAVAETSAAPIEATDAAKALAAENNIDLATVTGTGADGRVTQDDVKALLPDA